MDKDGNSGRQAQVLLAGIDLQDGNVKDAEAAVDSVLAASPEDEAGLLLKANIDIMNKKLILLSPIYGLFYVIILNQNRRLYYWHKLI